MTVKLSTELREAIRPWIKEYGYDSTQDFVEDAIQRRIREFKKNLFSEHTQKVHHALRKHKLSRADILEDFEHTR